MFGKKITAIYVKLILHQSQEHFFQFRNTSFFQHINDKKVNM
jgi:hypothetical protein